MRRLLRLPVLARYEGLDARDALEVLRAEVLVADGDAVALFEEPHELHHAVRVDDALAQQVLGGVDLGDAPPLGELTDDELFDFRGNAHASKVSAKGREFFNRSIPRARLLRMARSAHNAATTALRLDGPRPDPAAGVFETTLVVDGNAVEVDAHLTRLEASLLSLY